MKSMIMMRVVTLSLAFQLAVASLGLAVPPDYLIFDIGTTNPGDFASQGWDASPILGIATGLSAGDADQAFTWDQEGGLVPLPNLPTRNYCRGNGVNDLGLVVGTGATTFFGSGALPLIWENGAVAQLPLPSGETLGRAEDVNNSGVAVGSVDGGSQQRAAIYAGGTATIVTTTTNTGCYANTFFGINDAGLAVGSGLDPNDAARNVGFVYDSNTDTAFEVDPLPGLNGALNFAVSNAGHVVGSAMLFQGASVPFIWTEAGGSQQVPLPFDTSQGGARGVNSDGWVVGTASNAYAIPFLYDGEMTYRIADLLPVDTGWDLETNTFSSAIGISDCGIIVGSGVHEGNIRAYALIPDDVVAALLQNFSALGREDGIELEWGLALDSDGVSLTLERATTEFGPWQTVEFATGPQGTLLDTTAEPGQTYYYRLLVAGTADDTSVLGMVSAERTAIGALGVMLGAPAPNPTRQGTSVAYRLPAQQDVRISVHDVRGRLVRTVVDGVMDLGDHVMQWDGRGDDGVRAPAGMYFIQLQTAQASRVQRVVIVR
jgi:uncharacterized membrane protein